MADVVYSIVEHDGGWAYKAGDVFSETFPDCASAEAAAERVAAIQRVPGDAEAISWEDEQGRWHDETASGSDRPNTRVQSSRNQDRAAAPVRSSESRPPVRNARKPVAKDPMAVLVLAGIFGLLLVTLIGKGRRDAER